MTQTLSRSQKRHLQQINKDAAAVLAHAPSMRFLCRILDESGFFRDPFDRTGDSATAYRCGQQMTSRRIVSGLEGADPDALLKLLHSAAEARSLKAAITEEELDD